MLIFENYDEIPLSARCGYEEALARWLRPPFHSPRSPTPQTTPLTSSPKPHEHEMLARSPISLHHRTVVAGGQRRRCVGGSESKRNRALGRHFTQALENLWRHSPRIPPPRRPAAAATRGEANPSWQSPVLENAAFEEYYKVRQLFLFHIVSFLSIAMVLGVI